MLSVLSVSVGSRSYLSKPHAVPLVGRLLGLGGVHQLEARLVLLVKVGVLTPTSELRGILIWRQNMYITPSEINLSQYSYQ